MDGMTRELSVEPVTKEQMDYVRKLVEAPFDEWGDIAMADLKQRLEYANVGQDVLEQRTLQTLHDMSVRREALKKVYERIIAQLQGDPFERLIFIQCFAALDASEGHCLVGIYADEFNRTLTEYQEAMKHD